MRKLFPAKQQPEESRCGFCGEKLGLVQRVSGQGFCSSAHRIRYLRDQEELALGRLGVMVTEEEPEPEPGLAAQAEIHAVHERHRLDQREPVFFDDDPADNDNTPVPRVAEFQNNVPLAQMAPTPELILAPFVEVETSLLVTPVSRIASPELPPLPWQMLDVSRASVGSRNAAGVDASWVPAEPGPAIIPVEKIPFPWETGTERPRPTEPPWASALPLPGPHSLRFEPLVECGRGQWRTRFGTEGLLAPRAALVVEKLSTDIVRPEACGGGPSAALIENAPLPRASVLAMAVAVQRRAQQSRTVSAMDLPWVRLADALRIAKHEPGKQEPLPIFIALRAPGPAVRRKILRGVGETEIHPVRPNGGLVIVRAEDWSDKPGVPVPVTNSPQKWAAPARAVEVAGNLQLEPRAALAPGLAMPAGATPRVREASLAPLALAGRPAPRVAGPSGEGDLANAVKLLVVDCRPNPPATEWTPRAGVSADTQMRYWSLSPQGGAGGWIAEPMSCSFRSGR